MKCAKYNTCHIEKTIKDVKNMIFDSVVGGLSESAQDIIDEILDHDGCEDIDTLLGRLRIFNEEIEIKSSDELPVNVYPGTNDSNTIYNEFICVCAGETKFPTALKSIVDYCSCTEREISIEQNKRVVMITTKWDETAFDKHQRELEDFCAEENIDFYFFLVTDYGVIKIPFMHITGQDHYNKKMYFYAGMDSNYKKAMKNIGLRIVGYELTADLKKKKLYDDNECICDYIPKEVLRDFIFYLQIIEEPKEWGIGIDIDKNTSDYTRYEHDKNSVLEKLRNKLDEIGALRSGN